MFLLVTVGKLLNILIGGLGFPGEDHMDIVVVANLFRAPCYHISVKNYNNLALLNSPVTAENTQKPHAGCVHMPYGELLEFGSGVDHIIAVHQQEAVPWFA